MHSSLQRSLSEIGSSDSIEITERLKNFLLQTHEPCLREVGSCLEDNVGLEVIEKLIIAKVRILRQNCEALDLVFIVQHHSSLLDEVEFVKLFLVSNESLVIDMNPSIEIYDEFVAKALLT